MNTRNPIAIRSEPKPQNTRNSSKSATTYLNLHVRFRECRVPNPRVPLGLSLEEARELVRGNAIHQLLQNYQVLSIAVTQLATNLRDVLTHLREDPGGGRRRTPLALWHEPLSSHDDEPPRGGRRPPRQPVDDLRDMKFDPPEFEGNLNLEILLAWKQSIE